MAEILSDADAPMTLRAIHECVEERLRREIARSSVKNVLARRARDPESSVRRVGLGVYTV